MTMDALRFVAESVGESTEYFRGLRGRDIPDDGESASRSVRQ